MGWCVTRADVAICAERRARLAATGGGNGAGLLDFGGETVTLWRRFRDGWESRERLPRWLAELTLFAIPEREPRVERAKIVGIGDRE